jgi:hypothetical protein
MNIDYARLAKELIREKAADTPPSPYTAYGPAESGRYAGLFSTPGAEPNVISTIIIPQAGLESRLPVMPSRYANPLLEIISGHTAATGSNPSGVCDDPKTAGLTKVGMISNPFGRYSMQTPSLDVTSVGQRTNSAEPDYLNIINSQPEGTIGPTVPGIASGGFGGAVTELKLKMHEFKVSWVQEFARQIWTGNPTNNTASGGYKEFRGLDLLVKTGHVDAETGNSLDAMDSIVHDYNLSDVDDDTESIVKLLTSVYYRLRYLASNMGLSPVTWKLAMPSGLFYALVNAWPCSYLTHRCSGTATTGVTVNYSGDAAENLRRDMMGDLDNLTGQYLMIDHQKIPVIVDDSIPEYYSEDSGYSTLNDGQFASTIYFLPMTILGGRPSLYLEFFPQSGPSQELIASMAQSDSYFATDSGRFLWHKKPSTNWCVQMMAMTIPRLSLITPYLAAKIDNVAYTPIEHTRTWDSTQFGGYYSADSGRYVGTDWFDTQFPSV